MKIFKFFIIFTFIMVGVAYADITTVIPHGAVTFDESGLATISSSTSIITPSITIQDVDGHTDATVLTAANVSRAFITNDGQAGAVTLTLPAAANGYNFIAVVGTQYNAAWKIQRGGAETIYWSSGGTDTAGKTYFTSTNQPVGSRVSCGTIKVGGVYKWICSPITGTWTTD